jgi:flagellar basal-body rod modification protein FlgD
MSLPVSPTAATTATTSNAGTAAAAAPTVNEQQFLQLLVAQLQHQDPTQPLQGTDFVTQLAQFSLVEQSVNQTSQLSSLTTEVTGLSNNEATQLVGKTVTISGNTISFDGTSVSPANVTLAGPAAQVTATITDSNGNVVQTLNLGAEPAGPISIPWNGVNSSGGTVAQGTYTVNVSAADSSGNPVSVSQDVTGVVASMSFAQGYPEITLTSGAQAPISQLVSVGTPTPTP